MVEKLLKNGADKAQIKKKKRNKRRRDKKKKNKKKAAADRGAAGGAADRAAGGAADRAAGGVADRAVDRASDSADSDSDVPPPMCDETCRGPGGCSPTCRAAYDEWRCRYGSRGEEE